MSKYYRISDLINDYIKLKEEMKKMEINNLKGTIFLLENKFKKEDLTKIIKGFKQALEDLK